MTLDINQTIEAPYHSTFYSFLLLSSLAWPPHQVALSLGCSRPVYFKHLQEILTANKALSNGVSGEDRVRRRIRWFRSAASARVVTLWPKLASSVFIGVENGRVFEVG